MSGKRQPPPQAATKPVDAEVQAEFQQGLVLHQQGKLAEAERLYEEVLQRAPDHFSALHLLGVIALQTRRPERGVELITKAIGLNSNSAEAYSNLGRGLRDLKRFDEALASYDKAIALKPDFAEVYFNRGNALNVLKHFDEALASYDKAIALKPYFAEAYYNRANTLRDSKRPEDALASYDKAIALKPDYLSSGHIATLPELRSGGLEAPRGGADELRQGNCAETRFPARGILQPRQCAQ